MNHHGLSWFLKKSIGYLFTNTRGYIVTSLAWENIYGYIITSLTWERERGSKLLFSSKHFKGECKISLEMLKTFVHLTCSKSLYSFNIWREKEEGREHNWEFCYFPLKIGWGWGRHLFSWHVLNHCFPWGHNLEFSNFLSSKGRAMYNTSLFLGLWCLCYWFVILVDFFKLL